MMKKLTELFNEDAVTQWTREATERTPLRPEHPLRCPRGGR
jgi:hypothetical protein